jgi:uncharacterized membrane protein YjjP (DUF1212 family)
VAVNGDAPRDLLRFLCRLGHVLLATGEAVGVIEATLQRIGHAHGATKINVVAFPTALFVKLDDGEVHIDFTSEEGLVLRFDQVEAVYTLALDAQRAQFGAAEGLARIARILAQPAEFSAAWSVAGHVLMTLGIALILQPSVDAVGAALAFGFVVGLLKLLARAGGTFNTLLPTIAAFTVTVLALEAVLHGFPASPLRVVIASLVTFLPGGILAVATMDLAYGDVVSGASRFVTGLVQLMFLVLGIVTAATLVGLPTAQLGGPVASGALGDWAHGAGVVLFGIGATLHYSGRLRALPWVLLVLCVGAAGQWFGNAALGGYLSGFIGALMITPLAYLVQYRLGGPPAMVTFLPALWLLVPSSIGLIGLAGLVGEDRLAGLQDFITTVFAIVATAVGCLIGTWIYNAFFDPIFRQAGSMAEFMRRRLRRGAPD